MTGRFIVLIVIVLFSEFDPVSSSKSTFNSTHSILLPLIEEQRRPEFVALEYVFLAMFGFSWHPRPSESVVIPQYMIYLYQSQTGDCDAHTPGIFIGGQEKHYTNTIRSFFHEDDVHLENTDEDNFVRLWFNVSSIPDKELLTAAHLRVYVKRNFTVEPNSNTALKQKIQVFEILKPSSETAERISKLICVQEIIVYNSTWVSLNVLPAVLKWKNTPGLNHGLEIYIAPNHDNVLSSALKHVMLRRMAETDDKVWNVQKPMLVTYSSDDRNSFSRTKQPSKMKKKKRQKCAKGKEGKACRKRRKQKTEKQKFFKKDKKNPSGKKMQGHQNLCQRKSHYVNFSEIGWKDWVVAPDGYDPYYCDGNCPFPLSDSLNTTNHAIVQLLVNSLDPQVAPPVCCVATSLSPLSILYVDNHNKVVLKQFDNMVVEGCGCR